MIHWVALNMVEGLRPIHRASLLKVFGSPEAVFAAGEMELAAVPGIKAELAYQVTHFPVVEAENELKRAKAAGLTVICQTDPQYPQLLARIPDPPLVLYIQGALRSDELVVALVGSRKATPYGLNVAQAFAHGLAQAGLTIASGMARGVDARVHSSALAAGGRTIAVLGSGIDVIYPAEHGLMARKIAAQGALVSEFPLQTPPHRENFPVRNRIISGLSYGVIVIEASAKSGSLITARMAIEQGREVMAVPGNIFNEASQGCHALLKDGAALVQNWKDVVEQLPEEAAQKIAREEGPPESLDLTSIEKNVMDLLSFEQPRHIDQLSHLAGIKSQELLGVLVNLELKNYISQMPGKQFIRLK
jgi:DNA processing protein